MTSTTQGLHYIFATSAPFSHAPAAIRLSVGIATLDPSVHISVLIHANNVPKAQEILAAAPEVEDRIKLWPVGELVPHKEVVKSYTDMIGGSGAVYAQILQDKMRSAPSVFIYDVTAFWLLPIRKAVEEKFEHLKPTRVVGYVPGPVSAALLNSMGSEENGSFRWLARAALEKGIDLLSNQIMDNASQGVTKLIADAEKAAGTGEVYDEVSSLVFANDRICAIPGVPPFHLYEFWSEGQAKRGKARTHGMMQFLAASPTAVDSTDAWITFFPSDIVEPEAVKAAMSDPFISDGGKKPIFLAGPFGAVPKEPEAAVKAFLDAQQPKSVALVSFGTLVDAGHGADVLFEQLAASKTPFVLAAGGQKSAFPESTRKLIFIASDHLSKIPGVPPAYEYEYWSIKIDWTTSVMHHMMLDFNLAMQAVVGITDAYISCYASDVLEPETYAALKSDDFITDGGKKPVFMAGHSQEPKLESGLGEDVQRFLDRQQPRSVLLISFGTLMDGGHGADVLFAQLAELKIPFIFAGGGQSSALPQTTRALVDAAELEGRAIAPEWLNQVGVLEHPALLCFISHCGVNSIVEAALAEVPILTWGKAWDQIPNSAQLAARGHGIELVQHREGCGVGRPIAHTGEVLTGQPETLRAEIRDALQRVKGDEGERIRQNLKNASAEIRARRTGVWDEDIRHFVQWTKAD